MFNSINSLFEFNSKKNKPFEKENYDEEKRHVSFVDDENRFYKRRNTYAEHYLETRRSGSLAIPVKFYTEIQRKGKS